MSLHTPIAPADAAAPRHQHPRPVTLRAGAGDRQGWQRPALLRAIDGAACDPHPDPARHTARIASPPFAPLAGLPLGSIEDDRAYRLIERAAIALMIILVVYIAAQFGFAWFEGRL